VTPSSLRKLLKLHNRSNSNARTEETTTVVSAWNASYSGWKTDRATGRSPVRLQQGRQEASRHRLLRPFSVTWSRLETCASADDARAQGDTGSGQGDEDRGVTVRRRDTVEVGPKKTFVANRRRCLSFAYSVKCCHPKTTPTYLQSDHS
jgi:hypothetical protein